MYFPVLCVSTRVVYDVLIRHVLLEVNFLLLLRIKNKYPYLYLLYIYLLLCEYFTLI